MKILSAAEMGAVDRRSVEHGVSMEALMERAGEAVAAFCLRQYPLAARVMVLCGKGNNGGDGLVAARLLAGEGVGVRVLLLGRQAELKGEPLAALERLKAATADEIVEELPEAAAVEDLAELLGEADLLLDAVFGTGFKDPMRGPAVLVREALQQIKVPVVAVDLPSGWDADSYAEQVEGAFRADAVVTFTAPKIAHVFGHLTFQSEHDPTFAPVVIGDIGSEAEWITSELDLHWSGSAKRLTERARPINSNKGKFGHVLVVGGSYGTAGAPSMAAMACLRTGAGLVTAAVPRGIVNLVGGFCAELMVRGLEEGPEGSALLTNTEDAHLEALLKGIKVVALGPGLSTRGEAPEFARELVRQTGIQTSVQTSVPMVIDADALNAFAGHAELLDGRGRTLVLTPHPGEMARLTGLTIPEVEADRIGLARRFAKDHQLTLVLKGWRTLIAHPDGRVAVNTTGNPGLAKGGSGDILTGIVAAMLAQHPDQVAEAVEAAVYLHGLAADCAVQAVDEKTLLATEVIGSLSAAFRLRVTDEDGLEWICGLRHSSAPRPPQSRLPVSREDAILD